jgi:hypothetical protein
LTDANQTVDARLVYALHFDALGIRAHIRKAIVFVVTNFFLTVVDFGRACDERPDEQGEKNAAKHGAKDASHSMQQKTRAPTSETSPIGSPPDVSHVPHCIAIGPTMRPDIDEPGTSTHVHESTGIDSTLSTSTEATAAPWHCPDQNAKCVVMVDPVVFPHEHAVQTRPSTNDDPPTSRSVHPLGHSACSSFDTMHARIPSTSQAPSFGPSHARTCRSHVGGERLASPPVGAPQSPAVTSLGLTQTATLGTEANEIGSFALAPHCMHVPIGPSLIPVATSIPSMRCTSLDAINVDVRPMSTALHASGLEHDEHGPTLARTFS